MTMQIGERIIVGILAFITFASPLVSGKAAAGDIQPYRAQEITPYAGSDISPYQAEGIQPTRTEKIEEYRAQDVKPVQAKTPEPVQAKGITRFEADGVQHLEKQVGKAANAAGSPDKKAKRQSKESKPGRGDKRAARGGNPYGDPYSITNYNTGQPQSVFTVPGLVH